MKKFIVLVLLFSMNAQAACNWATGITPGPNKTFVYSEECHEAVGALIQSNKDLTAAIQLKDLALTNSDARTQLWMTSSLNEQDRLTKIDSEQKHNDFLYFGLGVLAAVGAGYAAAKLAGR